MARVREIYLCFCGWEKVFLESEDVSLKRAKAIFEEARKIRKMNKCPKCEKFLSRVIEMALLRILQRGSGGKNEKEKDN